MNIWAFCPYCKDRVMNKKEGGVLICEHGHTHINGYPLEKKKPAISSSDSPNLVVNIGLFAHRLNSPTK